MGDLHYLQTYLIAIYDKDNWPAIKWSIGISYNSHELQTRLEEFLRFLGNIFGCMREIEKDNTGISLECFDVHLLLRSKKLFCLLFVMVTK